MLIKADNKKNKKTSLVQRLLIRLFNGGAGSGFSASQGLSSVLFCLWTAAGKNSSITSETESEIRVAAIRPFMPNILFKGTNKTVLKIKPAVP